MKKMCLFTIQLVFSILISTSIWAQIPQGFSYQAVVRDAQGNIVQNQNVSFRFSLLENSASGTIVYAETQQTTTNNLGLVVLTIGTGTVQQGNFSTIQWGNASHFLKVELDVSGGSSYVNMGTTQLLSVPYALYAQKSFSDTLWTLNGSNIYNNNAGHVGIGLTAPNGKVTIQGDTSNVLFEVRDRNGIPVFIVYQDSVQVFVNASAAKTNKGSFAINAKTQSKANPTTYLRVAPDSSRIYTESPLAGFGVRDLSGGSATSYMNLTPQNYFIGHESGTSISPAAQYNVTLGFQAGKDLYTGRNNIFLGYNSGFSTQSGYSNIFIGNTAGKMNNFGRMNIYIGDSAGMNPNFQEASIFVGYKSGFNAGSQYNTFIGAYSGMNTNALANTFMGYSTGQNNTSGYFNTFLGSQSGLNNLDGFNNTYVGTGAGSSNISGSNNTVVGSSADIVTSGPAISNSTCVGYLTTVNTSNTVRLGNSSVSLIGGAVNWTVISDKSIKKNIQENVPGLDFINKLKPVTYSLDVEKLSEIFNENYTVDAKGNKIKKEIPKEILQARKEKASIIYTGFIAQDVAKAAKDLGYNFSGVHYPQNQKDLYSLSYSEFVVPLTKAVQELSQKVEEQQKIIEQLEKEIKELKK